MTSQNSIVSSILTGNRKKISAEPNSTFNPPQGASSIPVTLDELQPYEFNPRQSENPLFEDIKNSIRVKGLDSPPNITVRPGADHYIIRDGGNTRLSILRTLYEETGDNRFFQIECKFRPWIDELDTFTSHIVENELRAPMLFAERALAAKKMESLILEKSGDATISLRKLSEEISATGWSMNHSDLSVLMHVAESLIHHIPDAIWAGMGRPSIKKIRKLEDSAKNYCKAEGLEQDQFSQLWEASLGESDSANFQLNDLRENIFIRIRDSLRKDSIGIVEAEIDAVMNGVTLAESPEDAPSTPIRVPSSQSGTSKAKTNDSETSRATVSTADAQAEISQISEPAPIHTLLTPLELVKEIFIEFNLEGHLIEDESDFGFNLDLTSFVAAPDSDSNRLQAGVLAVIAQFIHTKDHSTKPFNQELCSQLFAGDWASFTECMYQIFILFRLDPEISQQRAFLALRDLEQHFYNTNF